MLSNSHRKSLLSLLYTSSSIKLGAAIQEYLIICTGPQKYEASTRYQILFQSLDQSLALYLYFTYLHWNYESSLKSRFLKNRDIFAFTFYEILFIYFSLIGRPMFVLEHDASLKYRFICWVKALKKKQNTWQLITIN